MMSLVVSGTEFLSTSALSLVLISPDKGHRQKISEAFAATQMGSLKELSSYPAIDDIREVAVDGDVIIVDLDPDPERALDVVENICSDHSSVTVMVYSACAESDLLVRCMRSGAREFLSEPILAEKLAEALVRASARQDELRRQKKTAGKLLVFVSAKGGSGVTTIATNFAVSLAKQSERKVALVDLDLYLGDAALTLGLTPKFSTLDALDQQERLDSELISVLLAQHPSGLSVLAAPDAIPSVLPSKGSVEKLMRVVREGFDYVVVDAGSNPADICGVLFDTAATVYLVVQASVCELRNSNRFVSRYFSGPQSNKLQVVLNRFGSGTLSIDEATITKAVTQPVRWKIPNDFPSAQNAQNTGVPMTLEATAISRVFAQMARDAAGQASPPPRKKKFGLF